MNVRAKNAIAPESSEDGENSAEEVSFENEEEEQDDEPANNPAIKAKGIDPTLQIPIAHSTIINPVNKSKNKATAILVLEAIHFLSERTGSSLHAIMKYLLSNYAHMDEPRLRSNVKKYILKAVQENVLKQTKGVGLTGSFKLSEKSKKEENKEAKRKLKEMKLKTQQEEKAKLKIKNKKSKLKENKKEPGEKQKRKQVQRLKSKKAAKTADTAKAATEPEAIAAKTKRTVTVKKQVNSENEAAKPSTKKLRKARKSIKLAAIGEPNTSKINKKLATEKTKAINKMKGDMVLESLQTSKEVEKKQRKKRT